MLTDHIIDIGVGTGNTAINKSYDASAVMMLIFCRRGISLANGTWMLTFILNSMTTVRCYCMVDIKLLIIGQQEMLRKDTGHAWG